MSKKILLLIMSVVLLSNAPTASAQIVIPTSGETGLSDATVVDTLHNVARFVASIIGILAILMIVVAGVMYITSGGDERRVDTAKRWLIFAVIGLIVALVAYVIVVAISNALGAGTGGGG